MQTATRTRGNNQLLPTPPVNNRQSLSAALAVLPLRLFLAISFLAAALDKISDKEFFDPQAIGYIGNQLAGFAQKSPLGGFLTGVAVPNATLFGASVLLGELLIGLGTLVGLFSRTAAFFGFILSITLWLTSTWSVAPFFLGSDLPYAMGWLVLAIAGAHPIYSLDGQLKTWLEQRKQPITVPGYPPQYAPVPVTAIEDPAMVARRRFVTVAGATLAAGTVTAVAWGNTLITKSSNQVASAVTTPAATTAATTDAASATSTPVVAGTAPVTTGVVGTTGNTTAATTTPATTKAATTAAPAVKGTVIAPATALKVGAAGNFTTPDTKESAIIIRMSDTVVKAFTTVCTHEGCDVSYVASEKTLACPCHGARFDANTGAALRGPARRPLKSYNVAIDNGNIVYIQA